MDKTYTMEINIEADIVLARKAWRELSLHLNYNQLNKVKILTSISELCRNMYLHAGGGSLKIESFKAKSKLGIKISATDNGPGIKDIGKALEPGYSTIGGLGMGLPGVKNLMDEFHVHSIPGKGTTITIVKWQLLEHPRRFF